MMHLFFLVISVVWVALAVIDAISHRGYGDRYILYVILAYLSLLLAR